MSVPYDSLLREGVAAAQSGQTERARALLMRAVEADQRSVQAWYWLSRVVEAPGEREICLENVLALDPAHTAVQAELAELRREMAKAEKASLLTKEAIASAIPQTAEERLVSEAAVEPLACPYCGVISNAFDRQCPACGRELYVRQPKSKTHSVYSLLLVLIWFGQANYTWLGLVAYYLFSAQPAAADSSSEIQTVGGLLGLLGIEGSGSLLLDMPMTPVLLVGGILFLFSLFVAWGLYRRSAFFYWLTVALLFLGLPALVLQAVVVSTSPVVLAVEGVFLLFALGLAFMAYEEFQWVEHRLSATLDRDVDSPSSLYARGRKLADREMWAKAALHWAKAVALSPGHPDYRVALASAYINLGQPERAWEHLKMAQQIEPNHPQLSDLVARARQATQVETSGEF